MISASVIGLAFAATNLQTEQAYQCSARYATVYVTRFAELPHEIQIDILQGGEVADPDQPFEPYDNITDPELPNRRLVLAGQSRSKWFVLIEHGGFRRHHDVFGFTQLWGRADSFVWHRSAALQGDPCIAINAFLDGVSTPEAPER